MLRLREEKNKQIIELIEDECNDCLINIILEEILLRKDNNLDLEIILNKEINLSFSSYTYNNYTESYYPTVSIWEDIESSSGFNLIKGQNSYEFLKENKIIKNKNPIPQLKIKTNDAVDKLKENFIDLNIEEAGDTYILRFTSLEENKPRFYSREEESEEDESISLEDLYEDEDEEKSEISSDDI
jgi:hypothetical protein